MEHPPPPLNPPRVHPNPPPCLPPSPLPHPAQQGNYAKLWLHPTDTALLFKDHVPLHNAASRSLLRKQRILSNAASESATSQTFSRFSSDLVDLRWALGWPLIVGAWLAH